MREEVILQKANFDPKLKMYWMMGAQIGLLVTFVGIPLMPVWWIIGRRVHQKQFDAMECVLTERTLNIRKGFIFRIEKSIPLDKIQDVGMKEGPLLRWLGLSSLAVETAGQSNPQGTSDAALAGVVGAPEFRDAILEQRDQVVSYGPSRAATPEKVSEGDVLVDIRDSLQRIEGLLEKQSG
ncbi:MAG: membrane protein YdbS with pleckstrin-like domain [Candidatus Paceibacteria bacterium]|jgi:membrane protein YdbS with pleckstrin-like domain